MHYHLEIVMPPTDNVQRRVDAAMERYSEGFQHAGKSIDPEELFAISQEDFYEEAYRQGQAFADFWSIGGRWSGAHLLAGISDAKLKEFYQLLSDEKITISGLQFGKQTLSPASQIEKVDELWRGFFPESGMNQCPIFDHSTPGGDILTIGKVDTVRLTADRFMVLEPESKKFFCWPDPVRFMLSRQIYNGSNTEHTAWNGSIAQAIDLYEAYRPSNTVADDWLIVTVDYHS